MKNLLLLLALPILLLFISCDKEDDIQIPDTIGTTTDLTSVMENILEETEVPGFAISIVKNNKLVYQSAFGYADIQAKKAYTNQTVQHIASIGKTFVGVAIVKAIEEGYFGLETDINDILPVTLVNPHQPDAIIRVKHLVTHTSGILDNPGVYLAENYFIHPGENLSTKGARTLANLGIEQREARTLEEILAEYLLDDGDLYSPDNFAIAPVGTTWSYSNFATGLAAYLIETATEMPFAEYVKEKVLSPLGMMHSTYDFSEVDRKLLVKNYLDKNTPYPLYGNDSYPEGSMYTSNEDLGKYLLDMIMGAQALSTRLFPTSAYAKLFTPQLPADVVPMDFADQQGIFWYRKGRKIQHGGNSFGVSTQLEFDANGGSGFSLMTNMDASFNLEEFEKVKRLIRQAVDEYVESN